MLNLGNPAGALRWWRLPADGVGLARIEFIIGTLVKVRPMALARFDEVADRRARRVIRELTAGYRDRTEYFVDTVTPDSFLAVKQHVAEAEARGGATGP
jgi:pyruvate, water dikinase